jgi:hypothetical protein
MAKFGIRRGSRAHFRRIGAVTAMGAMTLMASVACNSAGVGDPCTPEDEYSASFQNFSVDEVYVESRSMQCETRLCLANHFQGRVSCPYGQTQEQAEKDPRCRVPGSNTPVSGSVNPQLSQRRATDAVYCSCRCDGPDANARYCECPSGYACQQLVPKFGFEKQAQLAGSYCVREGTQYDRGGTDLANVCDPTQNNCP